MLICLFVCLFIFIFAVWKKKIITKALRSTVKRKTMKNINMTREEAINTIINLIEDECTIPMVSLGNGGAGFCWVDSNTGIEDFINYNFRVVPESEMAEDFADHVDLEYFDVCVEFSSTYGDNPYREQYLLWVE